MNILMINLMPLSGSGSGVYCENMANALIRQGHKVCVIFVDNLVTDTSKYNFKCHQIFFKDDNGKSPQTKNKVLDFNFPCMTTHPRSVFNFRDMTNTQIEQYENAFREAIKQEIVEFKPDVIHSGHIWISSAVASEFDIPLVITCHGTDIQGFCESDKYHAWANKAADSCKAIVCISDKNADEAKECFPNNADKCITMPNGYDNHVFCPDKVSVEDVLEKYNIEKKYKKIVSFAGKFAHFKGIDILLKAAKMYNVNDVATILAGDGALFEQMTKLKNDLKLDNVYFIHYQPHDALRMLYNSATVSLVPSRNEPFGLVVIEANACGTPVIGTNDGGIADILTTNTGILIDPEDPEALALNVEKILNNEISFDRDKIAKITKKKFSQDSLILKTIDLYKKAIKNY